MCMKTSTSKPVILLIHGIWHSPLTYTKLTSALQARGYEVHVPWLPSCTGARPPKAGFEDDVQLVRRYTEMLVDQGREIVMIMHSYGGVVGCSALEGLDLYKRQRKGMSGGVRALIGLAAHIYRKGTSIIDMVHEMGHKELIPQAFDVASDGSCFSPDPRNVLFGGTFSPSARETLFEGISDEEQENLLKTLSRANYSTMEAKVTGEAWYDIPLTYVYTTQDVTLPATYQDRILEEIGNNGFRLRVEKIDAGHSPFITNTQKVVDIIEGVVMRGADTCGARDRDAVALMALRDQIEEEWATVERHPRTSELFIPARKRV